MAGTIIELHGSRTPSRAVDGGTTQFLYFIFGEPDEATAYDLVLANSPAEWYGYTRREIDMGERPTLSQWYPVVTYQIPEYTNADPLPSTGSPGTGVPGSGTGTPTSPSDAAPPGTDLLTGVSFAITTQTQRVFKSFATVASSGAAGDAAPSFGKLIGVSEDGKIEGADVPVATGTFRRKAVLQNVTQNYFRNLQKMVGKTNEVAWWGFPAESLLFAGVTGSPRNETEYEFEFEFQFIDESPAETIEGVNGNISVPAKAGFHYQWSHNRSKKDVVSGVVVERPRFIYQERTIGVCSFSFLGI